MSNGLFGHALARRYDKEWLQEVAAAHLTIEDVVKDVDIAFDFEEGMVTVRDHQAPAWRVSLADWNAALRALRFEVFEDDDNGTADANGYAALCVALHDKVVQ